MLCSNLQQLPRDQMILRFKIQSYYIAFGLADFATMCGLKYGGDGRLPTQSNFHNNIFNGKADVSFEDIKTAFKRECKMTAGDSERCLKLAMLYIVYGMHILEDPKKSIDLRYLHLIDDMDRFNSFSWGRVAFDFLIKHTIKSSNSLEQVYARGGTLNALGFVYALQAWAYEVMPAVALRCAKTSPYTADEKPRILRWTADSSCSSDELRRIFNVVDASMRPVCLLFRDFRI